MASRLLVTIGTDGVTDWVSTPDGQRFNLGAVSALNLVTHTVQKGLAKSILDQFNRHGEVMASVDEGQLWELLAPKRARWSSDVSSSMPSHKAEPSQRKESTMNTLSDDLQAIERHVSALDQAASRKATNLSEGVQLLVKLANKIKSPNQSKNQTYYNLGAPDVYEVGDKAASDKAVPVPTTSVLSFDVYEGNLNLANQILATAEETVGKIDVLAEAGRPFNAAKAKLDVHAVTVKVAGILRADLTASWVRDDLVKLASRANEIHSLFASAK
jgi:hypothetical protein